MHVVSITTYIEAEFTGFSLSAKCKMKQHETKQVFGSVGEFRIFQHPSSAGESAHRSTKHRVTSTTVNIGVTRRRQGTETMGRIDRAI